MWQNPCGEEIGGNSGGRGSPAPITVLYMPLNLASKSQVRAFWFLRRRLAHALLRRSPNMDVEWEWWQKLAVQLSALIALVGVVGAFVLSWWRTEGLIEDTKIVADNKQGTLYVNLAGRLHPVTNLVSAQLITGAADQPAFVSAAEIAKMPKGPKVGIEGAPLATPAVLSPEVSRWAVCDTASPTLAGSPSVTGINGELTVTGANRVLDPGQAVLMSYGTQTFVVTSGLRMPLDPSDRAVAGPLGVEPGRRIPAMSRALFDAIPAGGHLVVPAVPNAGAPSSVNLGMPLVNGAVVVTREVSSSTDQFYVITGDGVQPISPVVAGMLRQRDTYGFASAPKVSPDRITKFPTRHALDVDYYPKAPLQFVDSSDQPVTCAAWERGAAERQGRLSLIAARGLPITAEQATHVIPLVGAGNGGVQADQVVFTSAPATFVTTTSSALDSPARQTLWLFDTTGFRYGVPFDGDTASKDGGKDNAMSALGLERGALRLAPWAMLQVWPAGPELSVAAAKVVHGTDSGAAIVTQAPEGR